MRNKNLISFMFFIVVLFSSCDFITQPYEPVPPPPPASDSTRYILLEDYTGHTCTNCPKAAETAKNIRRTSNERVIVMALHVGSFADATSSGKFAADFRTEAGTVYDGPTNFNLSKGGLPKGMVNRKNYLPGGSKKHALLESAWSTAVAEEININPNAVVSLKIENDYDESRRELSCVVKSTFFYDTLSSGPYRLVVCLVQDNIVAPQSMPDGSTNLTYVHNHALRDNLNGIWGVELAKKGSITSGKELTKTYSYTLPDAYPKSLGTAAINQTPCKVEDCHIIAYIFNDKTKEVIQVAEEKVIK